MKYANGLVQKRIVNEDICVPGVSYNFVLCVTSNDRTLTKP